MLDRFINNIESESLFKKSDSILLALSGGSDSIALFHLLLEADYSFSAAHVNYGLRGKEADKDEAFVRDLCKKYSINLSVKKIGPEHWVKGMNIQKEARDLRYAFFDEIGSTVLLSAHHKDDNVETILMNITRGTGIKGLLGMKALANGICRPLLLFEKAELEAYLKKNKFAWREDASNVSDKYKRNRFRHDIIPLLKEENPSLNSAIDRLIENVTTVANEIERSYENFVESFVTKEADQIRISKNRPDQLALHLFELLVDYAFNRDQVLGMIASLENVGKVFKSDTHSLYIDRTDLILIEDLKKVEHVFTIYEHTSAMLSPLMLRFSKQKDLSITKDEKCAKFDLSKLNFPLTLRNWRAGDRIVPLGMQGSKKISDILIDKKISRVEKENVYVLLSGDDIIWLPGILMSDKTKVDSSTKETFQIEMI